MVLDLLQHCGNVQLLSPEGSSGKQGTSVTDQKITVVKVNPFKLTFSQVGQILDLFCQICKYGRSEVLKDYLALEILQNGLNWSILSS